MWLLFNICNVRFDEDMEELSDISGTTDVVKQMCICVCLCIPLRDGISTKLDKSALIHMRETHFNRMTAPHETD